MYEIVKNYKDKYELLGSPIFLTNLSSFANTDLYDKTQTPERYVNFLKSLEMTPAFKNAIDHHKDFIIHNTICVNSEGSAPLFMYTKDKVVICIPEISKRDIVKHILGSIFFVRVGNINRKHLLKYVPAISYIMAKCFVRNASKTTNEEDLLPTVTKYTVGWLLKVLGEFQQQALVSRLASISLSFSNATEVNDVVSKIEQCRLVSEFLNLIAMTIGIDLNQCKISLIMKQGLDFALGLEDVAHSAYSLGMAHYFMYPSNLFFTIKNFNEHFVKDLYTDLGIIFSSR